MSGDRYREQAARMIADLDARRRNVRTSIEALALDAGVSVTTLRDALHGRSVPRLDTYFRLADAIERREGSIAAAMGGATLGPRNGEPANRLPAIRPEDQPGAV